MRRSSAALILATLVLSAATTGCGGDSDSGGLDPVAQAAEATRNEGTAQVRFTATVDAAGQSIPMTGEGVMSTRDDASGRLAMSFTVQGKRYTMHEIFTDSSVYLGGGPLEKQIPFGKKWMRIDFKKLIEEHGGDISQFDQGGGNATKTLDYLRGAGDVEKVGTERILGVQTTHYHAVVDLEKAAEEIGDEQLQKFYEKSIGDATEAPTDVWVDKQGRLRRNRMVMPMPNGEMEMTMDFVRFGVVLNAEPPPKNEVFDATGIAEEQIAKAGG